MAEKEKRKYLVIKMADVDQVAEGRGLLFDPFTQMTVEQLLEAIRSEREVDGRPTDNKYIICNQDEPYAEKVWQTILEGEDAKASQSGKVD